MKRYALVAVGLLVGAPLALANEANTNDLQQCPPGQMLVPSEKQPVAGFDTDQPAQQPQQPMPAEGTFQSGKVVPSAKTPKPSKIKSKEKVPQGTVPSAKTPK
ncbi:MAG TPA: hypothetical protein VFF06_34440 [Polyangia bacterium]|nr:hypothetical protein [Polyangia bacterium]